LIKENTQIMQWNDFTNPSFYMIALYSLA